MDKLKKLLKKYEHTKPTSYMDAILIFWAKETIRDWMKNGMKNSEYTLGKDGWIGDKQRAKS